VAPDEYADLTTPFSDPTIPGAVTSQTWSIPAVSGEVGGLRRAITRYATAHSVTDPPISDMKVAVSEAVTNSVLHAFPSGEPGTITVLVTVDERAALLTVVVTDDGTGVRPRPDSPGLGLGLPLITTLARTAKISAGPSGQGTRVHMTFGLRSAGVLS
jgi:anti-sigma regulatory factor (Ser/Thr protein kinase)